MRLSCFALVVTLVLAVMHSSPVLGHAVLTKASLEGTPIRPQTETTVTLSFNAASEPGFTKVILVDARNEERVLPVLPQSTAGKVSVTVPPLAPGTYGLRYKVLAADGHVTESVLRFTVAGD